MAEQSTSRPPAARRANAKAVGLLDTFDQSLSPAAPRVRKLVHPTPLHRSDHSNDRGRENTTRFSQEPDDHSEAITDFIVFFLIWIALPAWILGEIVAILGM